MSNDDQLGMFSYVCLGSNDLERAARFYDAVLGALGLQRCSTADEANWDNWIGWGTYEEHGARELALWICRPFDGQPATAGNGAMIALRARNWSQVDAFHAQALQYGGRSEGVPALRPQYNPDFYAAYVRDPDGNKLAAVCRGFTAPQQDR
jgi:catechol 2,3-dioxygenase-like lactoylglutathione lyase family enzyme